LHIQNKYFRTIWPKQGEPSTIEVIDQRKLPFIFEILELKSVEDAFFAIRDMVVRGAPLIGITAAWGMYLALRNFKGGDLESYLSEKADYLKSARPTSVNPFFTIDEILNFIIKEKSGRDLIVKTFEKVNQLTEAEVQSGDMIGNYGLEIIEKLYKKKGETINILTHCNAGWLACIDWGTATAPIYKAHLKGIPIHVWVDETRPRNQGARLTAFELGQEGVSHTVIADNTGGHLMQHGQVDLVITGSDRTTINGDVANKIGTYLKALAARDNNIPFYVALPSTSIDWQIEDGIKDIPIEERGEDEVAEIEGWKGSELQKVRLIPEDSKALNYGFDVTPARLVTGLITERGICKPDKKSILRLFPEKRKLLTGKTPELK
jgi:methylthioribose-1-phosphate isomerase